MAEPGIRRSARQILSHLSRQITAALLGIQTSQTTRWWRHSRGRHEIQNRNPRYVEYDRNPGRRNLHAEENFRLFLWRSCRSPNRAPRPPLHRYQSQTRGVRKSKSECRNSKQIRIPNSEKAKSLHHLSVV